MKHWPILIIFGMRH